VEIRAAERPAIRPTRWRRLLAAVADSKSRNSFSWKDDADVAAAAGGSAVDSDEHARSTCGVRELRQPLVRRSVRQRAAAARRPTSMVCWWQSGYAGGAEDQRRAPATTGHRAAACDHHDTRRHTATSLMLILLLRPAAAPRGSATGSWKTGGIERSALLHRVMPVLAESSRARARGAPT